MSSLYYVTFDFGFLSGKDIPDYLSCYSIHCDHNVPHNILIFSLIHGFPAFLYAKLSYVFRVIVNFYYMRECISCRVWLLGYLHAHVLDTSRRTHQLEIIPFRIKQTLTEDFLTDTIISCFLLIVFSFNLYSCYLTNYPPLL